MTRKCKLVLFGILALLLCVSVAVGAFSLTVAKADETTDYTTKYILADGTLSETNSDGSIAVDVEADGTLVFNRIEQFNAVVNEPDDIGYVAGATTYTLKPYGYNYNGGIIVYPAFKEQIVKHIVANSTTSNTAVDISATLRWRVVIPSSVTYIADFAFAYKIETKSSAISASTFNKVYGWNCTNYNQIGTNGMVGLSFEKGTTDYDLTLGAGIMGTNAVKELVIPARVTELSSAPTQWSTEEFNAYYTDDISGNTSDIRYLNPQGTIYARGRLEKVLTGSVDKTYLDGASSYVGMGDYHIGTFTDSYAETVTFEEDSRLTTIPAYAFSIANYRDNTTPISVPSLKSIAFPDSVKTIGSYAFSRNERLVNVDLNKVETIKSYAFYTCFKYGESTTDYTSVLKSAAELTIPDSVKTIETNAFNMCCGIGTVNVGSGLETVGNNAFLASSTYPMEITKVNLTEEGLKNWLSIDFGSKNGLITSSNKSTATIYVDGKELKNLVIPEGVTKISARAFENCTCLQTVTAGSQLQEIGANAFNGCSNLNSFTFPDKKAAEGSEYRIDGVDSALTIIGANAFSKSGLMEFVVPASVTSIGSNAFANCAQLNKVYNLSGQSVSGYSGDIETEYHGDTSLKYVGDFVFKAEEGETPVLIGYVGNDNAAVLPESYEGERYNIGKEAFKNNTTFLYLHIPANSVIEIGESAFEGAQLLESIQIDDGDENLVIGEKAFYNCQALKTVIIEGATTAIQNSAFTNCGQLTYLTINDSKLETIGAYAFAGCTSLTEIIMPDTLTELGEGAFYNCKSLSNVVFGANLQTISKQAFYIYAIGSDDTTGCLGKVVIPDTVKVIGDSAFNNAGVTELYIGSGVETIGNDAFAKNTNLTKVEFAEDSHLTTVGKVIFANSKIERLAFPDTVTTIYQGSNSGTANWNSIVELRLPASLVITDLYGNWNYNFSSNNNLTVYLPEVTDANRENYGKNMLGFLVHMIESYVGMNGSGNGKFYSKINCIIAPDKEAYNLMVAAINEFDSTNFVHYDKDEYLAKLFALGEVAYTLSDKNGNVVSSCTEQKLFSNEGAVITYKTATTENGATYWMRGNTVEFPAHVGAFAASGVTWHYDGVSVTSSLALTTDKYDEYEFTAQLSINAVFYPFEDGTTSKVYDGNVWTLPEDYQDLLTFTVESGDAVDKGEYTIILSLKNAEDKWSDGTVEDKTVVLTITPAEYEVVWGNTSKTYDGNPIGNELTLKLGFNKEHEITIDDFVIYKGEENEENVITAAINAGEYLVVIKSDSLAKFTNYTFTNIKQTFVINKVDIDISNTNNLKFGFGDSNLDLRDGWLYIYDDVPYISAQPLLGTPTVNNVKASYVRYRPDTTITLGIKDIPVDRFSSEQGVYVYSVDFEEGTNTGIAVGTYQAIATLSSTNYSFVTTDKNANDLLARGLVIVLNNDGTATVMKTWYIVEMENSLVDNDGNEYVFVSGWNYGEDVNVVAPLLEFGEISTAGITLSLSLNDEEVDSFGIDEFIDYINSSMPAGIYEIKFEVPDVVVDTVRHQGFKQTFSFTVAPKQDADMYSALNEKLQNVTFEYEYTPNRPQFLGSFNAVELVEFDYVTRVGYWAGEAANKYFSDKATITFNVEGMQSYDYREVNGFTPDDDYVPMKVGTYVVYYQVSVDSFASLVANVSSATSNRKDFTFTVVIYEVLAIPADSEDLSKGLVYLGKDSKVQPAVDESALYETIWSDAAYDTAGEHSVSFKLYDNVHYRWAGVEGNIVTVKYTVAKATNEWIRVPNIVAWTYATFDTQVNRIRAVAKFLDRDAGEKITFAVTKADGTAITGLNNFTVNDDGTIDDSALIAALNGLKCGDYKLVVTVRETANYGGLNPSIDFRVDKSSNSWSVTPNVMQWKYNDYDKAVNLILGEARIQDATNPVVFKVTSDKAGANVIIANFSLVNGLVPADVATKLAALEVGSYYLWASVAETDSYSKLQADEAFEFVVSKAVNDWKEALEVISWSYGSYDKDTNRILGSVIYGTVTYSVTKGGTAVAGLESFTEVTDAIAKVLAGLNNGEYTVTATVAVDDNHEALTEQTVIFTVAKGANDWKVPFDVISWAYGNYNKATNLIMGEVQHGTVTYSVTKDGTAVAGLESFTAVNDTIAGILGGLAQGSYTVTATVTEESNYVPIKAGTVTLNVAKAVNSWSVTPSISSWVKGEYNSEENVAVAADAFNSTINYVIYESANPENIIYKIENGNVVIDELANAEIGSYTLVAIVNDTANYSGLEKTFTFQIFAPEGLPWWGTLLIVVGSLGVAALILWILHEKGILQMLTGKIVIALRARMTVDATIAAVRANKRAEESKKSIARAEALDRLEAARKARAEERSKSPAERAAALEERAAAHVAKAEKNHRHAEKLKMRANKLKGGDVAETPKAPDNNSLESEVETTDVSTNNADE